MFRMALLAGLLMTASVATAESTGEMLSSCKELAEAKVQGDNVMFARTYDSGVCWGAFSSIQRVIFFRTQGRPLFGVCAPLQVKRSQLIAVFVEYARRTPSRHHENAFDVARDALQEAFPCGQR